MMDHPSSHGRPPPSQPPRRQLQLQGPRPTALKLHEESHKIKKPPLPPKQQPQQPTIIYAVSPKPILAEVSDFMSVVQRLTGLSSGDFSDDGAVSPAARLAVTEKASPKEFIRPIISSTTLVGGLDDITEMVKEVDVQLPGILSPAPAMLPAPVAPGFFSPDPNNSLSFFNEMSPFFIPSPSALFSTPIVSPLHSPDVFNLFMDF